MAGDLFLGKYLTLKHCLSRQRPREKTTEEIFTTVIEELYPNRNYCVSVMVSASLNKHSIPSAWKCVTADSVAQQGTAVVQEWIV